MEYKEPPWMVTARSLIGLRETPGLKTAPRIARMLEKLRAWWKDDETPWCGTFVATCLDDSGLSIPKHWYRAKAYMTWGHPVTPYRGMQSYVPPYGTVLVLTRPGGYHVAFLVGILKEGGANYVYILGGNQGNAVTVQRVPLSRVVAWRQPADFRTGLTGRPSVDVFYGLMRNAIVETT